MDIIKNFKGLELTLGESKVALVSSKLEFENIGTLSFCERINNLDEVEYYPNEVSEYNFTIYFKNKKSIDLMIERLNHIKSIIK